MAQTPTQKELLIIDKLKDFLDDEINADGYKREGPIICSSGVGYTQCYAIADGEMQEEFDASRTTIEYKDENIDITIPVIVTWEKTNGNGKILVRAIVFHGDVEFK